MSTFLFIGKSIISKFLVEVIFSKKHLFIIPSLIKLNNFL
jgi:hypothetical protein